MKRITKIILSFVSAGIMIFVILFFLSYLFDYEKQIVRFCEDKKEMNFEELTKFNWDKAYVDREYYGNAEIMKKKYNLEGDFRELDNDTGFRIAFYKDKKLVKSFIYLGEYLRLDSNIEEFIPQTLFAVTLTNENDRNIVTLSSLVTE
jgi:hypothetical protein